MTEAVFPLLGAAFVVLVLLPLSALLAKLSLTFLERASAGGPLHGLNLRYLILTGSSLVPFAWFLSAGLHQAESGRSVLGCLFQHHQALCLEPGFFALTLAVVAIGCALPTVRGAVTVRVARTRQARRLLARLEELVAATPGLGALRGRVRITDEPGFALGTSGWAKPCVFVGATFADRMSDDAMASALGHEQEHVRALDPLRYLVLRLAMAINPFGSFLLLPHAARWCAARETHCDREAVIQGSLPLALAEAIVQAARPRSRNLVALGAPDTAVLKFRVEMLLAFAERPPARCCHRGPSAFPAAFALVMLALLLPHETGTAALDVVHSSAERALTFLWR